MQHIRSHFPSIHVAAPILLFVLWLPGTIKGAAPFESLSLGIQPAININRNLLHRFWNPQLGIDGFLTTPFYYGHAQVGIRSLSYTATEKTVPDFTNIFIYAGWGEQWSIFRKWACSCQIQIGNNLMKFAQAEGQVEQVGEKKEYESELGLSIDSGFSYQPSENWSFFLSIISHHVYTYRPLRLTILTAGMSYTIPTPGWLREFLE